MGVYVESKKLGIPKVSTLSCHSKEGDMYAVEDSQDRQWQEVHL